MLQLFTDADFGGQQFDIPPGDNPILGAADNVARSCKSSGISRLYPDPNFQGRPRLVLLGPTEIPWLGDCGLDLMVSSARTED